MKTAILVASFGTTHLDTLDQTITATERKIAEAFPEVPVFQAFTSRIVRRRLKENYNMSVDTVEEALEKINKAGYEKVLLQPTLLIPGEEFDRLKASVQQAAGSLQVSVGRPLLTEDQDLDLLMEICQEAYPLQKDQVLLLMGHGTEHAANDFYVRMAEKMRSYQKANLRLCTVEGTPDFQDAVAELKSMGVRKAVLAPMMMVAGDHACNDMSGDDPNSLKSLLAAEGISADCRIQGLGQLEKVQQVFVNRLKEMM